MGPLGMPELIMIFMVGIFVTVLGILPFWFICKKAGLSPWLSLIVLVPCGVIVLPFVIAFTDWPALKPSND